MSAVIAEETCRRLTMSLPVIERQRGHLVRQMEEDLAAPDTRGDRLGNTDAAATLLFTLLLECGQALASSGEMPDLVAAAAEHERLGIDARHHARFGLALGQRLREAPVPILPHASVAAWCAAYWAIVRHLPNDVAAAQAPRARRAAG